MQRPVYVYCIAHKSIAAKWTQYRAKVFNCATFQSEHARDHTSIGNPNCCDAISWVIQTTSVKYKDAAVFCRCCQRDSRTGKPNE